MSYNGWTNYATWRINLEVFDGVTLEDFDISKEQAQEMEDYELRGLLKDYLLEIVENDYKENELASGWAVAFIEQVNLDEIIKHLREL